MSVNILDFYIPQQIHELQEWWFGYYHDRKYRGKKKKLLQHILIRERLKENKKG